MMQSKNTNSDAEGIYETYPMGYGSPRGVSMQDIDREPLSKRASGIGVYSGIP